MGCSVTQRISKVKQPRGGYIKPKDFEQEALGNGIEELNDAGENVSSNLVGSAVDYLVRFMLGAPAEKAFFISISGAKIIGESKKAKDLIEKIKGLDNESIVSALKLTGFDVCRRASSTLYQPIELINPDNSTIENIRTMAERSLHFFEIYGPKVLEGFTFQGGYTDVVDSGDGDFTTADTLWDFKVLKDSIKPKHTLQLLMYWRMGLHSEHREFKKIKYLGIYNPRSNTVFRIAISKIPKDVITAVEHEVIGYK